MRIPAFSLLPIAAAAFNPCSHAQLSSPPTLRDSRAQLPALQTPSAAVPAKPMSPAAIRSYIDGSSNDGFTTKDFCSMPGVLCDSFGAPTRQETIASAQSIDLQKLTQRLQRRYLNQSTCYYIRSYEYTPSGPNNGSLKPAKTDCQPSINFQLKSTVLVAPKAIP